MVLSIACDPGAPLSPDESAVSTGLTAASASPFAAELSSYFPPSEASGGWRKATDVAQIAGLGVDAAKLAELGAYLTSLPYENYATGVSGYNASNKAVIVIKDGWIVGEYYNQPSAVPGVYYLASNGKSIAMMLLGRVARDYPQLGFGLTSKLYDPRWLPQGFPLTDARKADITLDQVLRHVSGIVPEVQASIASSAVQPQSNWNFAPFTVGTDPDYPASARLYYTPGRPTEYPKDSTYSSVAFNHFSLILRNLTGQEASVYLRQAMLDPIGVGRMAYKVTGGMGDYVWATAGNGLSSARDFARLGYLMLHEGQWDGLEIFQPAWIRQFTTSAAYKNIRSNVDCRWGAKYPSDMYRTTGSGQNWALVVPSLDLLLTFNGRTPKTQATPIEINSLAKLFAAVTERYVACDGTIVPDDPPPSNTPPTAEFGFVCAGLGCDFTDGSTDTDGSVQSWTWDFGDGSGSTEQHPTHAYTSGGSYEVSLAVTDDSGASRSLTRTVSVSDGNSSPTAAFTPSCTELACAFTDGSSDGDGTVVAWEWSFGDGETSDLASPSYVYAAPGTYTVSLRVTDDGGATTSTSKQVTVSLPVANAPPIAGFTSSCAGLACTFTDTSTDTDGNVSGWSWTFGDGATSTVRNPSRTYASAGTYAVALTVTDDDGASHQRAASVTVTGPAAISLTSTQREDATKQYMILRWTGARSSLVDIWRNGAKVVSNTPNDGRQTISRKFTQAATYQIKVCEAATTTCSNTVKLVFN